MYLLALILVVISFSLIRFTCVDAVRHDTSYYNIAKYTVNTSWRVFDVRKTPVHKYVKNNAKRTSQELLTWVKTTSVSSQDFMNFGPQTPKNMTGGFTSPQ